MTLAIGLVLMSATPIFRNANHDSYPFSTYPMFARQLEQPRLTYAEGLLPGAESVRLPPEMIANDEPMQAMRTLKLTANDGSHALQRLCAAIAARVANVPDYARVRSVRIVRQAYDPVRYFEAPAELGERERLAQCPVRR